LSGCNFCDDITAELSDVTFGDAEEEPYSCGHEGGNFAISRREWVTEMLVDAASGGEIVLKSAPFEAVKERQRGVAKLKRGDLAERLHRAGLAGGYIPRKRVSATGRRWMKNRDMRSRDKVWSVSREAHAAHRGTLDAAAKVQREIERVANTWTRRLGLLRKKVARRLKICVVGKKDEKR
jgi:hypothetical protein